MQNRLCEPALCDQRKSHTRTRHQRLIMSHRNAKYNTGYHNENFGREVRCYNRFCVSH